MKEYIIFLPNEKAKTYKYVTLFILLINCIVFGFVFFNAADNNIKIASLIGTIICVVSLFFFLVHFYTGKFSAYRFEISFIISAILWFILGKYLLACCILCFAIIGFYANRKFKVVFTAHTIIYPSFPVKNFSWQEVNNAMLKDNVLTIDLKNNKLMQFVLSKDVADKIDELSFNTFCKEQMLNNGR